MQTAMQPTGSEVSREGLDDVRRSGRAANQQNAVLRHLRRYGPSTRQEISQITGLPINTVCPRCRELLDAGVIEVVGTIGKPARQTLGIVEEDRDL